MHDLIRKGEEPRVDKVVDNNSARARVGADDGRARSGGHVRTTASGIFGRPGTIEVSRSESVMIYDRTKIS